MIAINIVATIVICYLLGSVNNALIISKLKKNDIRKCGSGNPGAMNMFRNYGFKIGLLTLVLDAIKGALACLIGWFIVGNFSLTGSSLGKYIGAISVIIGHIFPVFLKFKGGKGIASTIGICFMLSPIAACISLLVGFVFILITKMGAVTSFIIIAFPLAYNAYQLSADLSTNLSSIIIIFVIFVMTLWAHRTNLKRLFSGTENKTDLFKKIKGAMNKKRER
ncbi:MAG: glycerol-3-phosphate 1-O-acyltransferase PlsY [Clostridiales bacterium]|nr:glycerol-3-phosphate 1-O-acyltransferase PlsY [Clostridiales bacterium]